MQNACPPLTNERPASDAPAPHCQVIGVERGAWPMKKQLKPKLK